jgi:hypothetical protein
MTFHDARSSPNWRKIILLNRAALLRAWGAAFPSHCFITLRLPNGKHASHLPPRGWDEHWTAAAHAYAEERRKKCRT